MPVAQVLLAAGAHISPVTMADYTPLHTACHFGQLNMVQYLLELSHPPDINQCTKMGFTPLHLAAQQCHSQVITLLLEKGADTNLRNKVSRGVVPVAVFAGVDVDDGDDVDNDDLFVRHFLWFPTEHTQM